MSFKHDEIFDIFILDNVSKHMCHMDNIKEIMIILLIEYINLSITYA